MSQVSKTVSYINSGDFAFDSNLVAVGPSSASLKLQRPASQTLYSGFNTKDADFSTASGIGTLSGATVSAGKLDCTGGTFKYLDYPVSTAILTNQGTIRVRYTPNYSNAPAGNRTILSLFNIANAINKVELTHSSAGGALLLMCNDNTGVQKINVTVNGAWHPVAGQEYELEIDLDSLNGATRVFIDGVQQGSTIATTFVRDTNVTQIRLGTDAGIDNTSDAHYDELGLFNAVQHTANFSSEIPRVEMTAYSKTDPSVLLSQAIALSGVASLGESATKPTNTDVKYQLVIDGVSKYWNGTAWVGSDGSLAQSNTATEIATNAGSLSLTGNNLQLKALLHSLDGASTPILTSLTLTYTFYVFTPATPSHCIVYAFIEDIVGGVTVTSPVLHAQPVVAFSNNGFDVLATHKSSAFDSVRGYAQLELIESQTPSAKYNLWISYLDDSGATQSVRFDSKTVPNQQSANLTTLT